MFSFELVSSNLLEVIQTLELALGLHAFDVTCFVCIGVHGDMT